MAFMALRLCCAENNHPGQQWWVVVGDCHFLWENHGKTMGKWWFIWENICFLKSQWNWQNRRFSSAIPRNSPSGIPATTDQWSGWILTDGGQQKVDLGIQVNYWTLSRMIDQQLDCFTHVFNIATMLYYWNDAQGIFPKFNKIPKSIKKQNIYCILSQLYPLHS